jgi:hypothetical protein
MVRAKSLWFQKLKEKKSFAEILLCKAVRQENKKNLLKALKASKYDKLLRRKIKENFCLKFWNV